MFNKFKIDEIIICNGVGKCSKKYFHELGVIVEKDSYFKDYCVLLENGAEEWFDEEDLEKI